VRRRTKRRPDPKRAPKKLASDLEFAAAQYGATECTADKLKDLLKDVPREKALSAIERAVANIKYMNEVYERNVARNRAGLAELERLRPTVFRGPLRVVGEGEP
jgi:hypothetical protein